MSESNATANAPWDEYIYNKVYIIQRGVFALLVSTFRAMRRPYRVERVTKLGLPASGGGMAGALFHDISEWMIAHGMPHILVVDEEKNDTVLATEDNIRSIAESLDSKDDGYKIHLGVSVK